MHPTGLASGMLPLWKVLEDSNTDAETVFRDSGLNPAKLRDPNARYSDRAILRAWELAVARTEDPLIGLRTAAYWHPSNLHALGFAWLASDTLKDAVERLMRYSRIITDGESLALQELAEGYELCLLTPPHYQRAVDETYDHFFAYLLEMCRGSYGENFSPLRVWLQRPEPAAPSEFYRVFRAPIEFNANKDGFLLEKTSFQEPLPTANAELAHSNDQIVKRYLAHMHRSTVGMQVRAKLVDQLSSGHATEDAMAEFLGLSPRTLQRKLKEEGTTYIQLLNDTRKELASQYISNSRLSISEISYLLGFAEPTNFTRAFRRWTGKSPSEYRMSA
jgi:AraC-like DNA-binding protein